MKRIPMWTAMVLFLVVVFVAPQYTYGQEETVQEEKSMKHAFLLNPVAIGLGAATGILTVSPEYQWAFHRYLALDVQSGYAYWMKDSDFTHPGLHAFTTELGLRIYPFGKALEGFYVVPRGGAAYWSGGGQSLTTLDTTLEIGYSWAWGPPGFIINVGGGGGGLMSVGGSLDSTAGNYLFLVSNVSVGYGF